MSTMLQTRNRKIAPLKRRCTNLQNKIYLPSLYFVIDPIPIYTDLGLSGTGLRR